MSPHQPEGEAAMLTPGQTLTRQTDSSTHCAHLPTPELWTLQAPSPSPPGRGQPVLTHPPQAIVHSSAGTQREWEPPSMGPHPLGVPPASQASDHSLSGEPVTGQSHPHPQEKEQDRKTYRGCSPAVYISVKHGSNHQCAVRKREGD